MKINKKEKTNKFNSIVGKLIEGTIVALESMDEDDNNYWMVGDFDGCEEPFTELDNDFDKTLVINIITGFVTFVPTEEKCKILNFELKEL